MNLTLIFHEGLPNDYGEYLFATENMAVVTGHYDYKVGHFKETITILHENGDKTDLSTSQIKGYYTKCDKPDGQGLRPDARQRAKTQSVCASLRPKINDYIPLIAKLEQELFEAEQHRKQCERNLEVWNARSISQIAELELNDTEKRAKHVLDQDKSEDYHLLQGLIIDAIVEENKIKISLDQHKRAYELVKLTIKEQIARVMDISSVFDEEKNPIDIAD